MLIKKAKRVEDPAYLAWCRAERCGFCPRAAVQPHHVLLKGMGGAQLRDDLAVPVCVLCHKRCHGETVVDWGIRAGGRSGRVRLEPIPRALQLRQARAHRRRYLAQLRAAKKESAIPW